MWIFSSIGEISINLVEFLYLSNPPAIIILHQGGGELHQTSMIPFRH